jgi:hypothetical protein
VCEKKLGEESVEHTVPYGLSKSDKNCHKNKSNREKGVSKYKKCAKNESRNSANLRTPQCAHLPFYNIFVPEILRCGSSMLFLASHLKPGEARKSSEH